MFTSLELVLQLSLTGRPSLTMVPSRGVLFTTEIAPSDVNADRVNSRNTLEFMMDHKIHLE